MSNSTSTPVFTHAKLINRFTGKVIEEVFNLELEDYILWSNLDSQRFPWASLQLKLGETIICDRYSENVWVVPTKELAA